MTYVLYTTEAGANASLAVETRKYEARRGSAAPWAPDGLIVRGTFVPWASLSTAQKNTVPLESVWSAVRADGGSFGLHDGANAAAGISAWYVDSSGGSDGNAGASPAAPFQTLTAVEAVVGVGDHVYLKSGSRFREQVSGWPQGVSVSSYGDGDKPIIDGRDLATNANFSASAGTTNVYEISWSHSFDADTGQSKHAVWEDDVKLVRATSLANCDATPGSFYAAAPTAGGPDTVHVHPTGSTNPTTDGKEYALTARRYCLHFLNHELHAYLVDLEGVGNSMSGQAIIVSGRVYDCKARDGRVHNIFMLGVADGCEAVGIEPGGSPFVSYADSSYTWLSANADVVYRNCTVDSGDVGTAAMAATALLMHSNGSYEFGTLQVEGCHFAHCTTGIDASAMDTVVCKSNTWDVVHNLYTVQPLTRAVYLGGSGNLDDQIDACAVYQPTGFSGEEMLVHGLRVAKPSGGVGPIWIRDDSASLATYTFRRCTSVRLGGGGAIHWLRSGNFVSERNVFCSGIPTRLGDAGGTAPASFQADENAYWNVDADTAPSLQGDDLTNYTDMASWRAYLAGLAFGPENASVMVNPSLTDPANGDFTIGAAAVLALGAGAVGADADDDDSDAELVALWEQHRVA